MSENPIFYMLPKDEVTKLRNDLSEVKRLLTEKQEGSKFTNQQEYPLTIKEAAEFLNLAVPTIYSKVSKGELPVMKGSKRLYFFRAELLEYLKSGRKKSNAEIVAEANTYLSNRRKAQNKE